MERKTESPPTPPVSERSPDELQAPRQEDASNGKLVQKAPSVGHQESLQGPAGEQQVAQHDDGRSGAPAVRLDMDLDVDVQMKAKIQGDLTLAILEADQQPTSDKGHSTKALES